MGVVTISRQFGAGGLTLGKMIAQKNGYTLFDSEILTMVAEKAKVSTDWVKAMEKEAGGTFQKILSGLVSKSLVDRILSDEHGYIDEVIYVDLLDKIITKIADEGNAVIIGRGSQYILKERKGVISVLLVAEKDDRIEFIENKYNLSHKQALQSILTEDKRRSGLYKKFGKEDYDEPGLYDMVINTSKVDLKTACDLVCQLVAAL
ncbi:MAG: cytidylate kinase-like family protein [Desulfobacterales bacterium]|jgi:cytidylate kinase|nr:cytidylate kinase-like family protein [Desulfobacterales bacterium]